MVDVEYHTLAVWKRSSDLLLHHKYLLQSIISNSIVDKMTKNLVISVNIVNSDKIVYLAGRAVIACDRGVSP